MTKTSKSVKRCGEFDTNFYREGIIDGHHTVQESSSIFDWSDWPKWKPLEKVWSCIYLLNYVWHDSTEGNIHTYIVAKWNGKEFIPQDGQPKLPNEEKFLVQWIVLKV